MTRKTSHNSTYKKLAVQWLNEVQFFNQNFVQVDSFVLRNRQLLIAAKRYGQGYETPERKQTDKRTTIKSGLKNTMETRDHIKRGDITRPNM